MAGLGASNALPLAPGTTLIGNQGMRSDPPALGGAFAAFNLAYAPGLMLGPVASGVSTGRIGFGAALAALATGAAVLGLLAVNGLPAGLRDPGPEP